LCVKQITRGKILIVSVYVNDLIFTGDDEQVTLEFKKSMMKVFDMIDLGKMRFFLDIKVLQKDNGIYICQRKCALEVLRRFGMEESNAVMNPIVLSFKIRKNGKGNRIDKTYYKQIVGNLMYITATRQDMMFVVSFISRFMVRPTELHLQATKRALRYLKGTANYGIFYKNDGNKQLVTFIYSDYAGNLEDKKSTSSYVFMPSGGAVSWSSKKQLIATLSTTKAKFVAAAACTCQAVWMRRILKQLNHAKDGCTTVICDSSSTIKLL